MDISTSIIVGVVSGILTAAFLYLLGKVWSKIVIPWYQRVTYQGIDVSGRWYWESISENSKSSFDLTLKQNAHSLSGHALVKKSTGDALLFKAKGTIWEGYVSLTMKTADRRVLSYSNTLLKVCAGGKELRGQFNYRNVVKDDVESGNLSLTRK